MRSSKIALIASLTSLIAVGATAVGEADAATRYAGPGSSVVSGQCTDESAPCRFDYATTVSNGGDTLIALPGEHIFAPANSTWPSISGVTLTSLPGAPMATIRQTVAYANACNCPTLSAYGASVIDRVRIINETPPGAGALGMADTVTVRNSILEGASGGAYTFNGAGTTGTFHGNVARAINAGVGLLMSSGAPVDISQSTIVGSSYGLRIDSAATTTNVAIHNTIVRGAVKDAQLVATGSQVINATFDHSSIDLADTQITGAEAHAVDGGANQTAEPLFADFSGGDFHPVAGSSTINNGAAPFSGTDIDGNVFGADGVADIGAYEYQAPVVNPPGGGSPGATVGKGLPGIALKVKISKRKLTVSVTCPKTAQTSCSGSLIFKQGKKSKTVKVKPIKPGKTAKIKLKGKKGNVALSLTLIDAAGATGSKTVSRKLR
jgi:hypothetical protein